VSYLTVSTQDLYKNNYTATQPATIDCTTNTYTIVLQPSTTNALTMHNPQTLFNSTNQGRYAQIARDDEEEKNNEPGNPSPGRTGCCVIQ